ncbi:phosphate transport system regulatory protein PhoU [Kibdelosporangium aridum]|uniref:Phosphate-specific transport system accessory protein PhoU n=1 Tax=Kibdelosporangium aridum TaxID=2030 RepID=A0A428ZB41_KIBAR|nr:phosphate signaling complex protein PhoU [Kibdelosporangium aridum]RSM85200.1 phosphate transport system regulatory protein PhoU [Kibdelosporangium aridum]
MREAFRQDLDLLAEQLADLAELADQAMSDATTALLDTDEAAVKHVEDAVDKIRIRHHQLDDRVVSVIARQQPVATDLRVLVAGLRISADVERMGELALHIAEIVRSRAPYPVVPPELRDTVIGMVDAAKHIIAKARVVITSRDPDAALELETDDDDMDRLQESLYRHLLKDSVRPDVETAIDITLLGRYYERYADHAVSIARRVAFLATGRLPEKTPTHGPY